MSGQRNAPLNAYPAPEWRSARDVEYAAYEEMRSLDSPIALDLPSDDLELDALFPDDMNTPTQSGESPTFKALRDIGITADGFDPETDPPPFIEPETGTAYWIGVFQPDKHDPENCVTSILSLGRNPDTGEVEAQLAPASPATGIRPMKPPNTCSTWSSARALSAPSRLPKAWRWQPTSAPCGRPSADCRSNPMLRRIWRTTPAAHGKSTYERGRPGTRIEKFLAASLAE